MGDLIRVIENCKRIIERLPKKDAGAKYCLEQIEKVLNDYYRKMLP